MASPPHESPPRIQVDPDQLSPEALRGLVEEFVTRDGTELTDAGVMIEQVVKLLRRGDAEIWFDPVSRTCNILSDHPDSTP